MKVFLKALVVLVLGMFSAHAEAAETGLMGKIECRLGPSRFESTPRSSAPVSDGWMARVPEWSGYWSTRARPSEGR